MAIVPITPGDDLPEDALISVPKRQLDAIGDAIRSKRDTVAKIEIPDMPMEIGMIDGGGGGNYGEVTPEATTMVLQIPRVPGCRNLWLARADFADGPTPDSPATAPFLGAILYCDGVFYRQAANNVYPMSLRFATTYGWTGYGMAQMPDAVEIGPDTITVTSDNAARPFVGGVKYIYSQW